MLTQDLFNLLAENPGKLLQFEYAEGKYVEQNYHITEVKNVKIDSVDCGGIKNTWNETVLQLWVASEGDKARQLTAEKSLSILNKVDFIEPIDRDAELYFEYGNDEINVSNFTVSDIAINESHISFRLKGISTQCKAADRKGLECGTTESACCGPTVNEKVACC